MFQGALEVSEDGCEQTVWIYARWVTCHLFTVSQLCLPYINKTNSLLRLRETNQAAIIYYLPGFNLLCGLFTRLQVFTRMIFALLIFYVLFQFVARYYLSLIAAGATSFSSFLCKMILRAQQLQRNHTCCYGNRYQLNMYYELDTIRLLCLL